MDAMQQISPVDMDTLDLVCDAVKAAADFNDPEQQLQALKDIGKFMDEAQQYIYDALADMRLVPVLLDFLMRSPNYELHYEAINALSHFDSWDPEYHAEVILRGALPLLISHLASPSLKVSNAAVLALGDIICDDASARDTVLDHGILTQLVSFIRNDTPQPLLTNVVFTLSNICRCVGSNLPSETISMILPVLQVLLFHPEAKIKLETLKAVRHLIENVNENIGFVVDGGLVPPIVELLRNDHATVYIEALRVLGQVVRGSIEDTNVVLNCGLLTCLPPFLVHTNTWLREEACWIAANIAAGDKEQIQGLIDSGLIGLCVQNLRTGPYRVQRQIVALIGNITYRAKAEQMYMILRYGAVEPLCALLDCDEPKVLKRILRIIKQFIKLTKKHGHTQELATSLTNCGALEKIQILQDHNRHAVSKRARLIIRKYVEVEQPNAEEPYMPSTIEI